MTSNLPARPDYFLEDAAINRAGATPLTELPELKPISAAELKTMLEQRCRRARCPPSRSVRCGPCAGLDQHRALRSVRVLGRSGPWTVVASGADRRHCRAVGRSAPAAGAGGDRRLDWISRGRRTTAGSTPVSLCRNCRRLRFRNSTVVCRVALCTSWTFAGKVNGMRATSTGRTGIRWTASRPRCRRLNRSAARRRALQERLSQRDRVQPVATGRLQQHHQRDRRIRRLAASPVAAAAGAAVGA